MENLHLDPFLYNDECEEHGKNVPHIVEPQVIDFVSKKIHFVFYCKKCFHKYGTNAVAWRASVTFKEFNDYFGFIVHPDN